MIYIKNKKKEVVGSSKNLAGIKRWANKNGVDSIRLYKSGGHAGRMFISFKDNHECECFFESYKLMLGFVMRWRNAYGSYLFIENDSVGLLSLGNYRINELVVND